jgi:hypothetical protein
MDSVITFLEPSTRLLPGSLIKYQEGKLSLRILDTMVQTPWFTSSTHKSSTHKEVSVMNIKLSGSAIFSASILLICFLVTPLALAAEMTPSSLVFDDTSYTADVEANHQKLHMLYGEVFDKTLPLAQREKAKRDFFKISQQINKKMHNRVMSLNLKEGAALSHTDTLLATHLLLMTSDMLSTLQQEAWNTDPAMQ